MTKVRKAGIQKLVAAITDEQGELRPISRIEFEIVGRYVRWSLWEGSTRLHTLTDRAERAAGFWSLPPNSWRCWRSITCAI